MSVVIEQKMNNADKQRIRNLFPNASSDFLDANIGFGIRPKESKPNPRSALVDQAPGKEKVHEVPSVSIVMYRVRLLDTDNAYAATKPLLDCLCEVGLITDDSPSDINLEVRQEKVAHLNEQRTTLKITYP